MPTVIRGLLSRMAENLFFSALPNPGWC